MLYFNSIKVRLELVIGFLIMATLFLNFNSIKVRLEPFWVFLPAFLATFQFHKGTIRTECLARLLQVFRHFNSIKVRLELIKLIAQILLELLFQFHKGTIRTTQKKLERALNLFQFHKGTIRTVSALAMEVFVSHFNSIKVRLEPVEF